MLKEATICKLCLEPVTNYICADCLFSKVKSWVLLTKNEKLLPQVFRKHLQLKEVVQNDFNNDVCIVCRQTFSESVCPCCYIYEIFSTILAEDAKLTEHFEKNFNFDFRFHHGYTQYYFVESLRQGRLLKNFEPVIISEKRHRTDLNICENCGQIATDLVEVNGEWLCETCREI